MKHQWHQQALSASNYVALCILEALFRECLSFRSIKRTTQTRNQCTTVRERERERERERKREREREREKGRERGKEEERGACSIPRGPTHARMHSVTDSACRTIIAIMPTQFTGRINAPPRRRRCWSVPLRRSNSSSHANGTSLKANYINLRLMVMSRESFVAKKSKLYKNDDLQHFDVNYSS